MKIVPIHTQDLTKAILSQDYKARNAAYRALYQSPVVEGKIREWAKQYELRDKTPDDVLQEAVILLDEAVRHGRFRGESKAETFLLGICKNLIRDSSKKVQRIVFKETIPDSALHAADDLADHISLKEETDAERRRDNALQEALGKLSDKCQEALRLYYFEQKNMAEVAEARGLANAEQAKKNVFRCRESLKELIQTNPILQRILST